MSRVHSRTYKRMADNNDNRSHSDDVSLVFDNSDSSIAKSDKVKPVLLQTDGVLILEDD